MATAVGSVSGLASGIQWADMIDQIMTAESTRQLTPVSDKVTAAQTTSRCVERLSHHVAVVPRRVQSARRRHRVRQVHRHRGRQPIERSFVVDVTAGSGAAPGSYQMEVLSTASAEKLGSSSIADVNAPLNLSGSFVVGGRQVTVAAGDSLSAIRDKINAANTGANASHVSASILTVSSGVNRLILTTKPTGSSGIELTENGGTKRAVGPRPRERQPRCQHQMPRVPREATR